MNTIEQVTPDNLLQPLLEELEKLKLLLEHDLTEDEQNVIREQLESVIKHRCL